MTHENNNFSNFSSYLIVTPAYNEEDFIEKTIQSVLQQTVLPKKWIIVDDGSTDGTASIIKRYAQDHSFICYHFRKKVSGQHYFASNVFAIMDGYKQIKELPHSFIAILDADIILPENYYELLFQHFHTDKKLGVASGIYENLINGKLHKVLNDRRSTPKAIQIFRRTVFEEIGGYLPLKYGGEDTISCVMARMAGWKAWSFPDIKATHLRPTGMGGAKSILSARFQSGISEHALAFHPLFVILKAFRRAILEKPYILGGGARMAGYMWAGIRGDAIEIPEDVAIFIQKEQLNRIRHGNKLPVSL